eukprot:SAG11_NODE_5189_length_1635_cov_3.432292_1_plen_59_part_10
MLRDQLTLKHKQDVALCRAGDVPTRRLRVFAGEVACEEPERIKKKTLGKENAKEMQWVS